MYNTIMIQGLSSQKAQENLEKFGLNVLSEAKKDSFFTKLIAQFNNYLTILLIIAAVLSFAVGETVDGSLILGIVFLNAVFGLYQEAKAEAAIASLKKMTTTKVRVIRDGKEIEIDSKNLVPEDVIFLEEGVKVPADAEVLENHNLEINEAALTGESLPVVKQLKDEMFMGTIVAKGRGLARVTQTGMHTKFGHVAAELSQIENIKTPLQKKLESLSRTIGLIGIAASFLVFGLSFLQGSGYFPSFLLAISLAVAVVPEGLPAVMTITLSIGVKEMAQKKAIIRKLSAIEALGSITLIATDKTGTLTTNKMQVAEVYLDKKIFTDESLPSLKNDTFSQLVTNGVLCSTATLVPIHDHSKFDVLGDPTEGALLLLAQKIGLSFETIRNQWKLLDENPFDSKTRLMSVTVKKQNETTTYTKGAPEAVLSLATHIQINNKKVKLATKERQDILKQLDAWAKKGLRVLAFAYSKNSKEKVFLGMTALHDPPRKEVKQALQKTHAAGINVVMITGDNEKTAEAIGTSIGLLKKGDEIITGAQLDTHTDKELIKLLPKIRIFARTSPFQKHRIVKLFQEIGEVVAVTGDGVNDAIALKQAQVGIAMGVVGTDVARETADMVLTDDNFATIIVAIEEGRNIIKNLKNAIKYLLACNIAEAITLIVGLLLGISHILYPIQLLYINLVTDGLPALSLAFSPRHSHVMQQLPDRTLSLLKKRELYYILGVGTMTSVIILCTYFIMNSVENELIARTAAFSVLALIQSFILIDLWLNHRYTLLHLHLLRSPIFLGSFIFPFIAQLVILSSPFIAGVFKVSSVSFVQFVYFIFFASFILLALELMKKAFNLHHT